MATIRQSVLSQADEAHDAAREARRRIRSMAEPEILFEARTPLGFAVRVSRARWELIVTTKHPVMVGREFTVKAALETPDEVRQSRTDRNVLLFYRAEATRRWVCAVAKQRDDDALLVTAYPTDAIKEGIRIWPK